MTNILRKILLGMLCAIPFAGTLSTLAQPPAGSTKPGKKGPEEGAATPPDIAFGRPETAALKAVLDLPAGTPGQRFRQIQLLTDLGRPDLAKIKLAEFLRGNPTAEQLANIAQQYGVAVVFRFGQDPNLAPEGATLADRILDEYHKRARKPEQLGAAIKKLSDPSVLVQADGMRELIAAGTSSVQPLVSALANPDRAAEHGVIKSALVKLDNQVVEPLLGVLSSDDKPLKAQVIEVLGRLEAKGAMPQVAAAYVAPQSSDAMKEAAKVALFRVVGSVPTLADVEILLRNRTQEYFDRQVPLTTDSDGNVTVWQWDANQKQSVPVKYREDEANVALAGRLAKDLQALFPENIAYRRLYWIGLLDAAAYQAGLDKPVARGAGSSYDLAKQQPAAVIEDVLAFAMEKDHIPAATVAAELLGEIGHADLLSRRGATLCPLVAATAHPDRRLRYAAANAVLTLDPSTAYAGSSYVPAALAHFVKSHGVRRALVAHPNAQGAQRVAALLQGAGYQADIATSGKQFLQLAAASPDYELCFLSSAIDHPAVAETHAALRQDRRTALLPIGLLAALEDTSVVKSLAQNDRLAVGYPQPFEPASMGLLVRDLQARAGRDAVSPEERLAQAKGALAWLKTLAHKEDQKLYDLRRHEPAVLVALGTPELAADAAAVLGRMGTDVSQRRLVEYASQDTQPLASRAAAATAFLDSVHAFGLRLTRPEILLQYGRYNASEGADRGTQQVLGNLLDAIEHSSRK